MFVLKAVLAFSGFCFSFLHVETIIPRERFFMGESQAATTESSVLRKDSSKALWDEKDASLSSILPIQWQEFCTAEFKLVTGSNFTGQRAVYVLCNLDHQHYWSLHDYRQWISANENLVYKYLPIKSGLLFAFKFQCKFREGRVSLPWPVKAKYLWNVAVDDCTLLDHLLEFDVTHDTQDYLKAVEMTNCNMETDTNQLFNTMVNFRNVSRDFDCGGEFTERLVLRNLRKTFSSPEESELINIKQLPKKSKQSALHEMIAATLKGNFNNTKHKHVNAKSSLVRKQEMPSHSDLQTPAQELDTSKTRTIHNEQQMINGIARLGQENQKIQHRCNYKHLRYLDQSQTHSRSKHHSHILLERSQYPALEFFNLSHSFISHMSVQMLEWRRYFPNMKYLDLSYNRIKYFATLSDNGLGGDPVGVLDLRHNNITTLTPEDLHALSLHSRTVFVDIRNNPLNCDCKLSHFVDVLRNTSNKLFKTYKYLQNVTCVSPETQKGKVIAKLEKDFCQALEVLVLVVPIIILCCCMVLLLAIFILTIRYRREIMILAFTRLHISLPCRQTLNVDKEYDAFVAYSEKDSDWVFHTLVPRLEQPIRNNGPGFKLCIHHRDFPLGRCIADNILDKVQDSRHTVLILSNHFLCSQWCKYEFKTAFTQSIMEKKQHLIMVLKEELDKQLIDHDLKRCLKTFTYVNTNDRLFWDKLSFALSDGGKSKDHVRQTRAAGDGLNRNQDHHFKANEGNELKQLGENNRVRNNYVDINQLVGNMNDSKVWHINDNNIHNPEGRDNQPQPDRHNGGPGQVNKGFMQDGIWDV